MSKFDNITFANKLSNVKREFLKAVQEERTDDVKNLHTQILVSEKLGWEPGAFPLFMNYTISGDGYLVKSLWLDVGDDTRKPTFLSKLEFEKIKKLAPSVIWIAYEKVKVSDNEKSAVLIGDIPAIKNIVAEISEALQDKTIFILPDNDR